MSTDLTDLIVELRDLIVASYVSEPDFNMKLYELKYDYTATAEGQSYKIRVFNTLRKLEGIGGPPKIAWLVAELAKDRVGHPRWDAIVKKLMPAPIAPVFAAAALPPELEGALKLFGAKAIDLKMLAAELRKLTATTVAKLDDYAQQFHLDDFEEKRLLAVAALERVPHTTFVRWLAERVIVERPAIAYAAAQALLVAAVRAAAADLRRIRNAAQSASDRLDLQYEEPDGVAAGHDLAARKRELQTAVATVDLRTQDQGPSVLSAADWNNLLDALLAAFDLKSFEQLCQAQLNTPLKFLVRIDEPFELVVVKVILLAREKGWETDLVNGAFAERPMQPVFAQLKQKVAPQPAPPP